MTYENNYKQDQEQKLKTLLQSTLPKNNYF